MLPPIFTKQSLVLPHRVPSYSIAITGDPVMTYTLDHATPRPCSNKLFLSSFSIQGLSSKKLLKVLFFSSSFCIYGKILPTKKIYVKRFLKIFHKLLTNHPFRIKLNSVFDHAMNQWTTQCLKIMFNRRYL